jgi:hypothetical protein
MHILTQNSEQVKFKYICEKIIYIPHQSLMNTTAEQE